MNSIFESSGRQARPPPWENAGCSTSCCGTAISLTNAATRWKSSRTWWPTWRDNKDPPTHAEGSGVEGERRGAQLRCCDQRSCPLGDMQCRGAAGGSRKGRGSMFQCCRASTARPTLLHGSTCGPGITCRCTLTTYPGAVIPTGLLTFRGPAHTVMVPGVRAGFLCRDHPEPQPARPLCSMTAFGLI